MVIQYLSKDSLGRRTPGKPPSSVAFRPVLLGSSVGRRAFISLTGEATLSGDGNPAGPAACVQLGGRLTDTVCSRGWLNNLPVLCIVSPITWPATHRGSQGGVHGFRWGPAPLASGQRTQRRVAESPGGPPPGGQSPKVHPGGPLTASQAREVRLTRRAIQLYVYGV